MQIWPVVTRLGEAEILLPVALLTAAVLVLRANKRRLALQWMALLCVAVVITTVSKVAFIGWGLGWAAINFTGVSGHAMFAAAIYPLLMVTLVGGNAGTLSRQRLGVLLGSAVAVLVGVSRLAVDAHSVSEVLAGWLVGGSVTVAVLVRADTGNVVMRPIVPFILALWVSVTLVQMQASHTHSLVTRLALHLSGHTQPFTRGDLLRSAGNQGPP